MLKFIVLSNGNVLLLSGLRSRQDLLNTSKHSRNEERVMPPIGNRDEYKLFVDRVLIFLMIAHSLSPSDMESASYFRY